MEPGYVGSNENPLNGAESIQPPEATPQTESSYQERHTVQEQEYGTMSKEEEYLRVLDEVKAKDSDKETNVCDGDASCLATCTTSDVDVDDPFKSSYSYEAEEVGDDNRHGCLTSCVGTRWFKCPELLYGSTNYGLEVDLWSLGCIFAELFTLEPLFPGSADIDQLSRIISVLGDLTEEVWPDCAKLPDYRIISFNKVKNPIGLEASLRNRSPEEVSLVKRLVCYDPSSRATAMELLQDKYFSEEPLPVPVCELHVPLTKTVQDEDSPGGWRDYNEMSSDSDFDDFGPATFTTTSAGFSIQFS